MRVPLSWLRDFSDCDLPPEEIADRLTLGGLEVEAIEKIGVFSDDVRVAGILSCVDHPRAGKLRQVELDLGGGRRATALTGAPNIRAGMKGTKVATAGPGALLIDAGAEAFELYTVQPRTIQGVESTAVLCSEMELGLSDDHTGVLIVEGKDAAPGHPLRDHMMTETDAEADVVLEVAILPNYGRCLSIIGIARELAALTRTSFHLELDATHLPRSDDAFDIVIADADLCSRYSGYVLEGITVKPSPRWMQRRLVLAGHKPICNLVDVTNYVMTEMGQPMHAFDLDRLPARNIGVRRAKRGETISTLDQDVSPAGGEGGDGARSKEPPRPLDDSILLITSGDRPVAVAGVIGGLESQIYPDTKNILLESANFDPVAIRKAMSALKVTTDSSYRFSREVDPALTVLAIQRATSLLTQTAGAKPRGAICDKHPRKKEELQLKVSRREICRSLGIEIERKEIHNALTRLGFTSTDAGRNGDSILVGVPGYRPDVTIGADVAEEVIRVLGFERVEPKYLKEPLPTQHRNLTWEIRQRIRDFLVGTGLQDIITYSLTTPEDERRLRAVAGSDEEGPPYVKILNPSSQERSAMRRTLLAGLLDVLRRNDRRRERIALFEIGLVWHPEHGDGTLPAEPEHLALVLSGPVEEATWSESRPKETSFFDMKGLLEGLLERLHLKDYRFERSGETPYHPGAAAQLRIGDHSVGTLGQLHPAVLEAYELEKRTVIAAEIELKPLIEATRSQHPFEAFSRFPPVRQDWNLVVDDDMEASRVMDTIQDTVGQLLKDIRLLNVYRGEQLGDGKKSLAFQLTFCADDHSLLEEDVNRIRDGALSVLEEKVGARLR